MQTNTQKKCYKRPAFWLILTTIIIGGLYWLGYIPYWCDSAKENIAEWQDERYFKNIEKQQSELERLYKADTYGGDTPEETMEMFIDALRVGDLGLASKYYIVEQQDEIYKKLPQGIESGGIGSLIDFYDSGSIKSDYYDYANKYELTITKTQDEPGFVFSFVLNKYTNKWKILEL